MSAVRPNLVVQGTLLGNAAKLLVRESNRPRRRSSDLRHSHDATNKSDLDLQAYEELAVRPDTARLESRTRYIGIEVGDALEMSEQTEI